MATERSSRDIERELEEERAALQNTLDEILNRLTFEEAWNRAGQYMRSNGGDFGQTLGRAIREKPIAVALIGIGVAWLAFGPSQARPYAPATRRLPPPDGYRDTARGAVDDGRGGIGDTRRDAFSGAPRSGSAPPTPATGAPGASGPSGPIPDVGRPTSETAHTAGAGTAGSVPPRSTTATGSGATSAPASSTSGDSTWKPAAGGSGTRDQGTPGGGTTVSSDTGPRTPDPKNPERKV
ncbi:hypothetical protein [Roseitranquillus sediminis]|uniref:hypothetical protein n=1 Tax=Roseitranquillus sediminis TaxID=2809051 RepID=UPI001D0C30AA|nr:hypothetical protein [Roseitranquillus sediminis]MBM9593248.1 hypothetical protein [Roseitranquillus sediminis]